MINTSCISDDFPCLPEFTPLKSFPTSRHNPLPYFSSPPTYSIYNKLRTKKTHMSKYHLKDNTNMKEQVCIFSPKPTYPEDVLTNKNDLAKLQNKLKE